MNKKTLKYIIEFPIAIIAIIYILLEEYIWQKVTPIINGLTKLKIINDLGLFISKSHPIVAASAFIIPILVLMPIKLLAVWSIAHGHIIVGGCSYLLIKIIGAACAKWIFFYAEEPLRSIHWINCSIGFVVNTKDKIKHWINQNTVYLSLKEKLKQIRLFLNQFKNHKKSYFKLKFQKYSKFFKSKMFEKNNTDK